MLRGDERDAAERITDTLLHIPNPPNVPLQYEKAPKNLTKKQGRLATVTMWLIVVALIGFFVFSYINR